MISNISKEEFKKVANKLHPGMDKAEITSVLEKENIKLNNEQIDSLMGILSNSELSEDEIENVSGGGWGYGGDDSKDD